MPLCFGLQLNIDLAWQIWPGSALKFNRGISNCEAPRSQVAKAAAGLQLSRVQPGVWSMSPNLKPLCGVDYLDLHNLHITIPNHLASHLASHFLPRPRGMKTRPGNQVGTQKENLRTNARTTRVGRGTSRGLSKVFVCVCVCVCLRVFVCVCVWLCVCVFRCIL